MKKRHNYDKDLIESLCKKQPKDNFNATDVARKYSKIKGIEYSVSIARNVQVIIKNDELYIDLVSPKKSVQFTNASSKEFKGKKKNRIITWAQAKTPIHEKLWENLLAYSKKIDADIIVIPGTYFNPTSRYTDQVKRSWVWDERLTEYLYATESSVHTHVKVISDTDILPTASKPLNSFHSVTGLESCIIGHPRQHMQVVPTMKTSRRKFMFTTGSITLPNYRKSRQGKIAGVHHKMGFLVLEDLDTENFTARHVNAEVDGSFQDLVFRVEDGKVNEELQPWEVMIFGDTHLSKEDQTLLDESRRLIEISNCKATVWHDLMDGYSINHHQMKDNVAQVIKVSKGLHILEDEIEMNLEFIREWKDTNMIIIPSNHPDWLDQWVRYNNKPKHAINSILFNNFQSILYRELAPKGLYAYVIEQEFNDEVKCLHRDDSYEVCGIELNNHGDLGANGAKGSPHTFAKLNTEIVSGDKHHAYTIDNAYGVGISCVLDHGYNKGLSNWVQSNGIILSNGKFQHLLYFNGKFTNLV